MKETTERALLKAYPLFSNLQEFITSYEHENKHALIPKHGRLQNIFGHLATKFYSQPLEDRHMRGKVLIVFTLYELLHIYHDIIVGKRDAKNDTLPMYSSTPLKDKETRRYLESLKPHITALHEVLRDIFQDSDAVDEDLVASVFGDGLVNVGPCNAQVFEFRMTVLGVERWKLQEYAMQSAAAKRAGAGATAFNLFGAALMGIPGLVATAAVTVAAAYRADSRDPGARPRFWMLREAANQPGEETYVEWRKQIGNMLTNESFNQMLCGFYTQKAALQPR